MSLLNEFTISLGLAIPDLVRIISTAPKRYKVYSIPKKHGGVRIIAQPSRELKVLQRFVLDRYLRRYPIHPAAMAYERGRNIYENAVQHAAHDVFLKLDFEAFFSSIKASDWRRFTKSDAVNIFEPNDISIATRLLFWGEGKSEPQCLSIGAPTSPILSNILLFNFDSRLSAAASDHHVRYTRYADDITISASSVEEVIAFERIIRREVTKMRSPKLTFNQSKRGIFTKGQRRLVTGLVVTPVGQVSIGRERKRTISVLLHKLSLGELGAEKMGVLKGLLGFTIANEPSFVDRMRTKYGSIVVDSALRFRVPSRTERR
jgi:RNA-directed DNA polymerase